MMTMALTIRACLPLMLRLMILNNNHLLYSSQEATTPSGKSLGSYWNNIVDAIIWLNSCLFACLICGGYDDFQVFHLHLWLLMATLPPHIILDIFIKKSLPKNNTKNNKSSFKPYLQQLESYVLNFIHVNSLNNIMNCLDWNSDQSSF